MSTSPIAAMFDRISPSYDLLNHLLSLNLDKVWRRRTAKTVAKQHPQTILDLATGTADLAIALAKYNPQAHIIGMDFSEKMLEIGQAKIVKQGFENQIELQLGDASALPLDDKSFDVVTVAFGVRNFEDRNMGLAEIHRVLKPKGEAVILEFSMPPKKTMKLGYRFYFKHILPLIGNHVSKDPNAYTYLPESVERFPDPDAFLHLLDEMGLKNGSKRSLTFGIATLYQAEKR